MFAVCIALVAAISMGSSANNSTSSASQNSASPLPVQDAAANAESAPISDVPAAKNDMTSDEPIPAELTSNDTTPENDESYARGVKVRQYLTAFDECTDRAIFRGEEYAFALCAHLMADAKVYSDSVGLDYPLSPQDAVNAIRNKIVQRYGPEGLQRSDALASSAYRQPSQAYVPNVAQPAPSEVPLDNSSPAAQENLTRQRARALGWCVGGSDANGETKWIKC